MPPHRISVGVFLSIDSKVTMGYSSSDMSVVYYLTCSLDILKVYTAMSKVGLALEILKLAGVDDSGSISDANVLSGQAVQ